MKNIQEEIRALIREFTDNPFTEKSIYLNVSDTINELLNRFGIQSIPFNIQHAPTHEDGTIEHLLTFTDFDIKVKLIIKTEASFGNEMYYYFFSPIESHTNKGIRLEELINTYTGYGKEFADLHNYIEPDNALSKMLADNQFENVQWEIDEVGVHQVNGHVAEEHRVVFSEYNITTILRIETIVLNNKGEADNYYIYYFHKEEDSNSDHKDDSLTEYPLSFQNAIEECMYGNVFIRGENYASGIYVRNHENVLWVVDGKNHHEVLHEMMITEGAMSQRYKAFSVANKKAIGLE